jgi:hypothetical protein
MKGGAGAAPGARAPRYPNSRPRKGLHGARKRIRTSTRFSPNQALNGAPPPDPARGPGGVFVYGVSGAYWFHDLRSASASGLPAWDAPEPPATGRL